MDEEEKKRQAASAAFAQAERQNRDSDSGYAGDAELLHDSREARRSAQALMDLPDSAFYLPRPLQELSEKIFSMPESDKKDALRRNVIYNSIGVDPAEANPFATQWDRDRAASVPPAAASAFSQLDAPAPGPLDYDPATAAGLPQETQDAFRQNWDENLAAAKKAVESMSGPSKEDKDALAVYTDHLVKMAEDYQSGLNRVDRAQAPADPYAQQREREASVARRMGMYDLFADPTAKRTLYTPQTAQTNAYQAALDGGAQNTKPFFDYF